MKNKRGATGDHSLTANVIYLIIALTFFIGMFYFVTAMQDGAAKWEDFYSKEIANLVNLAEPGQEVFLDVSHAASIAFKNEKGPSDIFTFDNVNNKVIVSLRQNSASSFSFANKVDVIDARVELPSGSAETTRLYFKILEEQRGEDE